MEKYSGTIFKEARSREILGMGYRARRYKILWKNKTCSWNYLMIEWGIRWSDQWQIFPIKNDSHNAKRSISFGFWKLHFTISYYRKEGFNQNRKLPFKNQLRRFYQLIC